MDLSLASIGLSFGAGLASVLSPCVAPVLPIIVTGTERDSRLRPLAIVGGLALTFIAMGVLGSIAGSLVAQHMRTVERIAGAVILLFGALMLADINLFKKLTVFSRVGGGRGRGLLGGLLMGLSLGLVWIPCVGPLLSGVLALVATAGQVSAGVVLLAVYSLGLAIPMLLVAYASQWFRGRFRAVQAFPVAIRIVSGLVLVGFGLWILVNGMVLVV
ncbi:MAG: cytochrome c biogenesis CcdA family protein [Pseudomonadota bacterium]